MSQVLLSDLAFEQLQEISADPGERLLNAIERLRSFPQSAPRLTLEGYEAYRQLTVQPYRVIYKYLPEEDQVRIYCIIQLRRKLPDSEFLRYQIF
jgi:plasmid stabilization system protein ParE